MASLISSITKAPFLSDAKKTRARFSSLLERSNLSEFGLNPLSTAFKTSPKTLELIMGIASHSPYLWKLVRGDDQRLLRILTSSPDALFDDLISTCNQAPFDCVADEPALLRCLRQIKQEAALLIALADIGGVWTLEQVTEALSRLADAALKAALKFSLMVEASNHKIELSDDIEAGCGLVVFALGKHGAGELNYSSDIDLVVW